MSRCPSTVSRRTRSSSSPDLLRRQGSQAPRRVRNVRLVRDRVGERQRRTQPRRRLTIHCQRLEVHMATLQKQIADKFLAKLEDSKDVDAEKIDQLRTLLTDTKKLKADDLVKVFSLPAGGDLK